MNGFRGTKELSIGFGVLYVSATHNAMRKFHKTTPRRKNK